jgi:hypothetical protein
MTLEENLQIRLIKDEVIEKAMGHYSNKDAQAFREYLSGVLDELLALHYRQNAMVKNLMYDKLWDGFTDSNNLSKPSKED